VPDSTLNRTVLTEPKGPTLPSADSVFLTPRIVDRRTFDELAGALRTLIDSASRESDLLARRAEAAAVILDQLERFIGDNRDPIERAAEVLTGIDDRASAARSLLGEIDRRAAALERMSRETERSLTDRTEAFHAALRTLVNDAMARFDETEDQLAARAASARRDLGDRLDALRARGDEMLDRLARRAEASIQSAEVAAALADRLDAARAQAERAGEALAAVDETCRQTTEHALESVAAAGSRATAEVAAAAQAGADELARITAAAEPGVDAVIVRLRDALGRIESRAGEHTRAVNATLTRAGAAKRSLVETIAEAEAAASSARAERAAELPPDTDSELSIEVQTLSAALLGLTERVMLLERSLAAQSKPAPRRASDKPAKASPAAPTPGVGEVEGKPVPVPTAKVAKKRGPVRPDGPSHDSSAA
jgi:hypothetical protein